MERVGVVAVILRNFPQSISTNLKLGFLVRIAFLVYGEWHDRHAVVKYTDIDYHVFSDAAQHVANGRSPFERHTYRYTPLLAYLLLPNIYVHFCFGKLLFVFADLITAYTIYAILKHQKFSNVTSVLCTSLWIYNPITIAVSTRGNAEAIICLLVLSTLLLFYKEKFFLAGVMFGFAVHFKLYPVIYALTYYIATDEKYLKQYPRIISLLYPTEKRLKLALGSMIGFIIPTMLSYLLCKDQYLKEALLYHVTRKDIRHNFSPYFYMLYLTDTWNAKWLSIITFFPQVFLLAYTSLKFSTTDYLPLCLFSETFIFVILNKVCTSQYFLWYLCLLPLIVPQLDFTLRDAVKLSLAWLGGQGLWLLPAYLTEFQGMNCFSFIWLAGLVFYLINVYILCKIVKCYK